MLRPLDEQDYVLQIGDQRWPVTVLREVRQFRAHGIPGAYVTLVEDRITWTFTLTCRDMRKEEP